MRQQNDLGTIGAAGISSAKALLECYTNISLTGRARKICGDPSCNTNTAGMQCIQKASLSRNMNPMKLYNHSTLARVLNMSAHVVAIYPLHAHS